MNEKLTRLFLSYLQRLVRKQRPLLLAQPSDLLQSRKRLLKAQPCPCAQLLHLITLVLLAVLLSYLNELQVHRQRAHVRHQNYNQKISLFFFIKGRCPHRCSS